MEIVEGFVAVVIPYIVSICPHADGWGIKLFGGPEAENTPGGVVLKHWARTYSEAKVWASDEIGRRFQKEFGLEAPQLKWETLVCNPPGSDQPESSASV
jgi:hypothetical protein